MNETNQQCLSLLSELHFCPRKFVLEDYQNAQLTVQKADSTPTLRNGGTISTRTIPQTSSKTASGFNKNSQSSLKSQSLKQGPLRFWKLVQAPEILRFLS
jgi:hypothetical protein